MKILILVVLAFVIIDVLIVAYVVYRRCKRKFPEKLLQEIRKTWKTIIRQSDSRHAIMDADKLLDYTLGKMGFKGSLGNKLKKSQDLFKNINAVWAAHKVRNNIAHQINYQISEKSYKKTMMAFKQAFKDLKIF